MHGWKLRLGFKRLPQCKDGSGRQRGQLPGGLPAEPPKAPLVFVDFGELPSYSYS